MDKNPWDLDLTTWWWIIWIVWFFVGEWLGRSNYEQFTHHVWWVRNLAWREGASIILFLMYALLLWINWHFIKEGWNLFSR